MNMNDPREALKQRKKHYTIAMISDSESAKPGIQVLVPFMQCGQFIQLKNKEIITMSANTCKSYSAVAGLDDGTCPNGDYADELRYAVKHLSQGKARSKLATKFLQQIDEIAGSNISNHVFKNEENILKVLENLCVRAKGTAFAFSGNRDNDTVGVVWDKDKNPVARLYSHCGKTSAERTNGTGLPSLFSSKELNELDSRIAKCLDKDGKNCFKTVANNKEASVYPKYHCAYFLQALIQVILVDYENKLSKLDEQKIYDNWNSFLNDLSNTDSAFSLFENYAGDKLGGCPQNFAKFCLKKFLDKTDLLKEIDQEAGNYKLYAEAANSFRNILSMSDHANQVLAITVDTRGLTYDDLFVGADNYLYVPLRKAYTNMNSELKDTLESLGGQLKYKPIKLNQTSTRQEKATDVKKFGCRTYKTQETKKNANGEETITQVEKYSVPTCYNSNIAPDDFKKLMQDIEDYNKISNDEFMKLGLDRICGYVGKGLCLSQDRVQKLICNKTFMDALCKKLLDKNADGKYKMTYRVIFDKLVSDSNSLAGFLYDNNDMGQYVIPNLLSESIINKMFELNCNVQTKVLCELDVDKIYKNKLINSVDNKIICDMLKNEGQKKKANEILKLCSMQLREDTLQGLDFSKQGGLEQTLKNNLIFSRHKNLLGKQIRQIDFSELDEKCTALLLSNDYLPKLSEEQLLCLFDQRMDLFEKSTVKMLIELISSETFKGALDQYEKKQDILSLINFEKIMSYAATDAYNRLSVTLFIKNYLANLSDDKIISLRVDFFNDKYYGGAKTLLEIVRGKITEVSKKNLLYQNILKLRSCEFNDPWQELKGVLNEIEEPKQKTELIRYLFMNYESYFYHLNRLLTGLTAQDSEEPEILKIKKLVTGVLKSPTDEKPGSPKIINKVFDKIIINDVLDPSLMLNSIVKTFVDA